MGVPEHLWRFPTRAAIEALAHRFDLPNDPSMQDWEWQVADSSRIDELLGAYEQEPFTDDERFVLVEILLQSFDDLGVPLERDPRWLRLIAAIEQRIALHIYSVWYWADEDGDNGGDVWRVTPGLRALLARHRHRFEQPPVLH